MSNERGFEERACLVFPCTSYSSSVCLTMHCDGNTHTRELTNSRTPPTNSRYSTYSTYYIYTHTHMFVCVCVCVCVDFSRTRYGGELVRPSTLHPPSLVTHLEWSSTLLAADQASGSARITYCINLVDNLKDSYLLGPIMLPSLGQRELQRD